MMHSVAHPKIAVLRDWQAMIALAEHTLIVNRFRSGYETLCSACHTLAGNAISHASAAGYPCR